MNAYRIKELAQVVFERRFTNLAWDKIPEIHGLWIQKIIMLPEDVLFNLNKHFEGYEGSDDHEGRTYHGSELITIARNIQ